MFRETASAVERVTQQGCKVVEMETATLYAIGHSRSLPTLALFVVSDQVGTQAWQPQIKEPEVRRKLNDLCELAFKFCIEEAHQGPGDFSDRMKKDATIPDSDPLFCHGRSF